MSYCGKDVGTAIATSQPKMLCYSSVALGSKHVSDEIRYATHRRYCIKSNPKSLLFIRCLHQDRQQGSAGDFLHAGTGGEMKTVRLPFLAAMALYFLYLTA
ncbi:MAG: hypothetical protein B6D74_06425 [gamma proteobacterium symbiont of Ctena orbiculata]|nr:MAG: hypothetical protein B6D74_06425 [gamma proteobacterium symbiont of Ctena orbiculata]